MMIQAAYYRKGRGLVRLPGRTAAHLKDSLYTATLLVCREAHAQHHRRMPWTVSTTGASARCPDCGQTAVITLTGGCLFVDSCLHTPCRSHSAEQHGMPLAA